MKQTGWILIGGLLLISLSHGSNSRANLQTTCAAAMQHKHVMCHLANGASSQTAPDTPATLPESTIPEQVEEQNAALTCKMLQLMNAFGKLVMVI